MGIPSVGRVGEERRIKEIQDKVSGLDESMEKIINAQVGFIKGVREDMNQVSLVIYLKQNKLAYSHKRLRFQGLLIQIFPA